MSILIKDTAMLFIAKSIYPDLVEEEDGVLKTFFSTNLGTFENIQEAITRCESAGIVASISDEKNVLLAQYKDEEWKIVTKDPTLISFLKENLPLRKIIGQIKLDVIPGNDRILFFKSTYVANIIETTPDCIYPQAEIKEFSILASETNEKQIRKELYKYIHIMWEEIALWPDEKLAKGAREVKQNMLQLLTDDYEEFIKCRSEKIQLKKNTSTKEEIVNELDVLESRLKQLEYTLYSSEAIKNIKYFMKEYMAKYFVNYTPSISTHSIIIWEIPYEFEHEFETENFYTIDLNFNRDFEFQKPNSSCSLKINQLYFSIPVFSFDLSEESEIKRFLKTFDFFYNFKNV